MTLLYHMPDYGVVRSETLFESRQFGDMRDSWYSSGEIQVTAGGDLILHTKDSGYWVAMMIGEMVALYHQWIIVDAADVPRLVGDRAQAFDVVRSRLAIGENAHSIDVSKRFYEWLTTHDVSPRSESYDEHDD